MDVNAYVHIPLLAIDPFSRSDLESPLALEYCAVFRSHEAQATSDSRVIGPGGIALALQS